MKRFAASMFAVAIAICVSFSSVGCTDKEKAEKEKKEKEAFSLSSTAPELKIDPAKDVSVDVTLKDGKEITKADLKEKRDKFSVKLSEGKKITITAEKGADDKVGELVVEVEGKNKKDEKKTETVKVKIVASK